MRASVVVLSGLLCLSACGSPTVSEIGRDCGSDTKPFVEYWPCQKPRLQAEISAPDDIKAMYLAIGDAVAERIKAKTLTDGQGKLMMATAYQAAVAEDAERRRPRPGGGGGGPATFQVPGISALPPGAVAVSQPPKPIYCHSVGPNTSCF